MLVRSLVVTASLAGLTGYASGTAALGTAAPGGTALGSAAPGTAVSARATRVGPEANNAWKAAAAAALSRRADANSLAAAAALAFGAETQHTSTLELAVRASELAPGDAAIGWIQVRLCANTPGCDVRDAATAMRWLDPDNAAAWLPTLAAALRDKDTIEVDRVLADMAQGERFDLYWNRIVVILFDAIKSVAKTLPRGVVDSDADRLGVVLGVVAAEFVPPFAPLFEACHESQPGTERRDSCQKIARDMQQGDTIVAQIAGLNIERRFVASEGREFRALSERRRVLDWRVANADPFDTPMLPWLRNARARWRVARMRNLRRDEDVVLAILREQGLPIDPPEVR
jgi:hypothetical protein